MTRITTPEFNALTPSRSTLSIDKAVISLPVRMKEHTESIELKGKNIPPIFFDRGTIDSIASNSYQKRWN